MLGPGSGSLIESAVPYTYREVRSSYGGAKAAQERDDIMFRWFARPLSFPIAWLALRLGLSPNHVTYLSLVLNLLGLALMASGIRSAMATGVGIILLALILDAADGNMARTAQRFSPLGEWLEGVGAYVLYAWLVSQWKVTRVAVAALIIPVIAVLVGALVPVPAA